MTFLFPFLSLPFRLFLPNLTHSGCGSQAFYQYPALWIFYVHRSTRFYFMPHIWKEKKSSLGIKIRGEFNSRAGGGSFLFFSAPLENQQGSKDLHIGG